MQLGDASENLNTLRDPTQLIEADGEVRTFRSRNAVSDLVIR